MTRGSKYTVRCKAKGYLEGVQIIRDVRGIPVIRPRYDLYTSLGEYFEPADYGIKQLDQLAARPNLKTNEVGSDSEPTLRLCSPQTTCWHGQ